MISQHTIHQKLDADGYFNQSVELRFKFILYRYKNTIQFLNVDLLHLGLRRNIFDKQVDLKRFLGIRTILPVDVARNELMNFFQQHHYEYQRRTVKATLLKTMMQFYFVRTIEFQQLEQQLHTVLNFYQRLCIDNNQPIQTLLLND